MIGKVFFSYTKEKITATGLNSDIFHFILMVHCLFIFHHANNIWTC